MQKIIQAHHGSELLLERATVTRSTVFLLHTAIDRQGTLVNHRITSVLKFRHAVNSKYIYKYLRFTFLICSQLPTATTSYFLPLTTCSVIICGNNSLILWHSLSGAIPWSTAQNETFQTSRHVWLRFQEHYGGDALEEWGGETGSVYSECRFILTNPAYCRTSLHLCREFVKKSMIRDIPLVSPVWLENVVLKHQENSYWVALGLQEISPITELCWTLPSLRYIRAKKKELLG